MRLRTKLVLAITGMVFVLATASSYLYLAQFLRQRVIAAYDTSDLLSRELAENAVQAVPDLSDTRVDTNNPAALRRAIEEYMSTDRYLADQVRNADSDARYVYDASIVNSRGIALVHSNPAMVGKPVPIRMSFAEMRNGSFRQQLSTAYSNPRVYEISCPIQFKGSEFGTARIGISTVFLADEIRPKLIAVLQTSGAVVLIALLLAAGLSSLVLGPLDKISSRLDRVAAGESAFGPEDKPRGDEYGKVSSKIADIDRQIRDARQVFAALQNNVEQMMANLQDGLMLFTRDGRAVLVSTAVERFLQKPRAEMLGRNAEDIFSSDSPLDVLVCGAFALGQTFMPREFRLHGRRVQVSLDFIEPHGSLIGALLTLRDAESVRRIEDEIELSRRMSAMGRLTSGVAHEVKNPINAIVLHLENLRQKLNGTEYGAARHVEVIETEIHRLDRVVQTLVDFTRPVELRLQWTDLGRMLDDVVSLTAPDAERCHVEIIREASNGAMPVRVDRDLVKQVLVNVVLNGVQAMPGGGILRVSSHTTEGDAVVEVGDTGGGIPAEIQDKIFDLYFTTKKSGTGIGLAQAYQVMQLHNGSIDFRTEANHGTVFSLRFPVENGVRDAEMASQQP